MMNKKFVLGTLAAVAISSQCNMAMAQTIEKLKYADFEHWVTREIKESAVLGGKEKTVYEIGPTQTIKGQKPYTNLGGSQWATSNVMAKVAGVVKCSNAVFPDTHGSGKCVKMTTLLEHVKALGIINMDVLVNGSIFLGRMDEPISSSKNPYSKMEMGIKYTKRPKYLTYDYRVSVPASGTLLYSPGFGSQKKMAGQDHAEVYVLLQRRWEDSKGNIHAARVGTGRERFGKSTSGWVNGHKLEIHYGDISGKSFYKPWMGLIPKDKSYYARNSKGKMVPVIEEAWDDANATPTHMLVMASAGCGTAYVGMVGMTLWVDNMALEF